MDELDFEKKATILVVDDTPDNLALMSNLLKDNYKVKIASSGEKALKIAASDPPPDLILLDVDMPGMSGYEVCRALRDDPASGDLPVIFLSGMVGEEDRLAGYEAGGDDYLTKPASAEELRAKIRLQLANRAERSRLKQDLSSAFSTAMTAMSSSAEIGAVLQLMRASFNCPDYAALCREMLNALGSYGLEASVKIHGQQGAVSFSTSGPCSPLEDSVLTNMSGQGRLFEFGSRTSCSYAHITIIVRSKAGDDPERHGRMKDNLALLAEGADARVVALDGSAAVLRQHESLAQMTASTREALQGIDRRHREQGIKSGRIFQDLQRNFDRCMLTLGVTQSQEEELANMLQEAANHAKALYDEGLEIGAHMESILEQLESAGQ